MDDDLSDRANALLEELHTLGTIKPSGRKAPAAELIRRGLAKYHGRKLELTPAGHFCMAQKGTGNA
ncbi:hypothetical protein [Cereibacter sphaeroides]|jgi:hypothetical protein|uniref:hypothetical protein n=1 Tax=Cereibacter sphaeroides TaxID=1063 RepID=UPI0003176429